MNMRKFLNRKHFGFSVAEVAMNLIILGVIATVCLPLLFDNTQERELKTKLKKMNALLASTGDITINKYGFFENWKDFNTANFGRKFGKQMYVNADCGTDILSEGNQCFPSCPNIYTLSKTKLNVCTSSRVGKFLLSNGNGIAFQIENSSCNTSISNSSEAPNGYNRICGTLMVDLVNKPKPQNLDHYGKDLFLFYITAEGIMPAGAKGDGLYFNDDEECKVTEVIEDKVGCTAKNAT